MRTQGVLPARAIDSLAQMQAVFARVPVLLRDATGHPCHRAQAAADRAADYSGKKKVTRKNTLIAYSNRYSHYLGPATSGTTPDYQLLKKEFDGNPGLLDLGQVLADLGYLSLLPESLPHRKPWRSKKRPVTALMSARLANNQAHAAAASRSNMPSAGPSVGAVLGRSTALNPPLSTTESRTWPVTFGIGSWPKRKRLSRNKSGKWSKKNVLLSSVKQDVLLLVIPTPTYSFLPQRLAQGFGHAA